MYLLTATKKLLLYRQLPQKNTVGPGSYLSVVVLPGFQQSM